MIANVGLADSDYVYAVSVDEDFPILDSIAQEKIYYDKFAPLLIPMIVIAAVALGSGAGRSGDSDACSRSKQ